MITKEIDIAIVGGGLIGMLSAYYLAKSGQRIVIFDKSDLANESSWAGGGILTPLYPWRYADAINTLAFRSQSMYAALIKELQQYGDVDPEYYCSGMLIAASDLDRRAYAWLARHKIAYQQAQDHQITGLLGGDYLSFPTIYQVRNPNLAGALKSALQQLAVVILERSYVTEITQRQSNAFTLETTNGIYEVNKVLISAGAWSGKVLKSLGVDVSIRPIRGQMLLFKAERGLLPAIILADGKYMIPRKDGHVLVGSTMEDVGFNKSTTQEAFDDLLNFVIMRCPALSTKKIIRHWSGLRPASPQGIPYISQHPAYPGLFINSGHFRNGVVLAPASAELIRDLILEKPPKLDFHPYALIPKKRRNCVISFQKHS